MPVALKHGYYMMGRELLALWRQPWWIAITLMQPIIWLLLFGAMFERITDIPGFASADYIQFLTPGVVVMTAFFSATWSGMGMIQDLDRGVTDRLLVSPVARVALISGKVMQGSIVIVIQSAIMIALALAVGATFPGMWQLLVLGWMTAARASLGHPAAGATARTGQAPAAIRP